MDNVIEEFNVMLLLVFKLRHGRPIGNTMTELCPYWNSLCLLEVLEAAEAVPFPPPPAVIADL
jgi:hypothetical protein